MAKRVTGIQREARAGTPVQVNIDDGAARAWNQGAVTLARVANVLADEADRRAIIQANREGTKQGAFGVPNLRDENTISGEAFNRAAIQSYTTRLELQSRSALNRIETENATNPAAFATASQAYMQGVSEEIQNVAPWLVPTFQQRYLLQEQQHLSKVTKQYAGMARDQARADVFNLSEAIRRDQEENASQMFSDNVQDGTAAFARMLQDVNTLDAKMNQIGPDGMPLFSELERAKQMQAARDNIYVSGVKGFVQRNGSSYELIRDLIDGEMEFKIQVFDNEGAPTGKTTSVNIRSELSDDKYNQVIAYAKQQLVFENARAKEREEQYDKILETNQKANELTFWARIEGAMGEDGERLAPVTKADVYQAAQDGTISTSSALQMMNNIDAPGVDVSEEAHLTSAWNIVYQGRDVSDYLNNNRMFFTDRDAQKLRIENAKIQSGELNMSDSQRQMLFKTLQPSGPLEALNPDGERRRNEAMTEYDFRVAEGENPVAVRRDLEDRSAKATLRSGETAYLVKPRFFIPGRDINTIDLQASGMRLQDALKNGNISKSSYHRQVELLQRWADAQGMMPQTVQGAQ